MVKFENNRWTARLSEEFTFDNVRQVAATIAAAVPPGKPFIISYDPRFLADRFAEEAAKVFIARGIKVFFTERDTPLPIVEWEVSDKQAAGAMVVTGADLPAEYGGITLIGIDAEKIGEADANPPSGKEGSSERFEPRSRYFAYLSSRVDAAAVKRARPKIALDLLFGCSRGYLDWMLEKLGCRLEVINGQRDVLFGGEAPVFSEKALAALLKKSGADLAITVSVNADRFWLIDHQGKFRGELPDGIGGPVKIAEEFAIRGGVL